MQVRNHYRRAVSMPAARRGLGVAIAAGAVVVVSAAPAIAGTITVPAQGGNDQVTVGPGTPIYAGYDFTYVSGATTAVETPQLTLDATCTGDKTVHQFTITLPSQTYTDNATNSNGWVPSGAQADPSVYQASAPLPDFCNGGTATVATPNMGPFIAQVFSSDTATSIQFRFHHGLASSLSTNGGTGTSWSATKSVVPSPMSGVSAAPALGRLAPEGLAAVFAVSVCGTGLVLRRRRRQQESR